MCRKKSPSILRCPTYSIHPSRQEYSNPRGLELGSWYLPILSRHHHSSSSSYACHTCTVTVPDPQRKMVGVRKSQDCTVARQRRRRGRWRGDGKGMEDDGGRRTADGNQQGACAGVGATATATAGFFVAPELSFLFCLCLCPGGGGHWDTGILDTGGCGEIVRGVGGYFLHHRPAAESVTVESESQGVRYSR
jgi:hypothetical protein